MATTAVNHGSSTASIQLPPVHQNVTTQKIEAFAPERFYNIGDQAKIIWSGEQICTFTEEGWTLPNGKQIVYFPNSNEWLFHLEDYPDNIYHDQHYDLRRIINPSELPSEQKS